MCIELLVDSPFNTLSVSPAASGFHDFPWEPAVNLNWFLLKLRYFSVVFKILSLAFNSFIVTHIGGGLLGFVELLGIFWLCWLLLSWVVDCEMSVLSGLWTYVACYPGWSIFHDKQCLLCESVTITHGWQYSFQSSNSPIFFVLTLRLWTGHNRSLVTGWWGGPSTQCSCVCTSTTPTARGHICLAVCTAYAHGTESQLGFACLKHKAPLAFRPRLAGLQDVFPVLLDSAFVSRCRFRPILFLSYYLSGETANPLKVGLSLLLIPAVPWDDLYLGGDLQTLQS